MTPTDPKQLAERARQQSFDEATDRFTNACMFAADWRNHFHGAAYASRVKAAIAYLKKQIAEAEQHPELTASPAVPEGFVLVPKELTDHTLRLLARIGVDEAAVATLWAEALASAPSPPVTETPERGQATEPQPATTAGSSRSGTTPHASSPMPGAELASKQEPLDEDFQRVLDDNLFDLYARDKPSPDDAELVRSGRIKAGMLRMGESIEFGSDADMIEALCDRLAFRSAEVASVIEMEERTMDALKNRKRACRSAEAQRDAAVEALREARTLVLSAGVWIADAGNSLAGGTQYSQYLARDQLNSWRQDADKWLASLTDKSKGEDG